VTASAASILPRQTGPLRGIWGLRAAWLLGHRNDSPSLDRMAIGLSGLCLVHCVASAVFFASVASVGGLLLNPLFHEIGLAVAIGFGLVALARGVIDHGYMMPFAVGSFGLGMMAGALSVPHDGGEVIWTMVGVGVLALGHDLNFRATRTVR
jgi:MerC mercury resistance protein